MNDDTEDCDFCDGTGIGTPDSFCPFCYGTGENPRVREPRWDEDDPVESME